MNLRYFYPKNPLKTKKVLIFSYQNLSFNLVDLAGIEPVSKLDPIQPSTCLSNYCDLINFLLISKQEVNEIV